MRKIALLSFFKITFLTLFCVNVFTQTPTPTPTPEELTLNQPREREIEAKQIHQYQVALKKGEFVRFEVEDKELTLRAVLSDPEDKSLCTYFLPPSGVKRTLVWVAETEGVYKIELTGAAKRTIKNYDIRLAEKRPSTEIDKKRAGTAQRTCEALVEYFDFVNELTEVKAQAARNMIDSAQQKWSDLNDQPMVEYLSKVLTSIDLLQKAMKIMVMSFQESPESLRMTLKEVENALEFLQKFPETSGDHDWRYLKQLFLRIGGDVYVSLGEADKGIAYYNQALAICRLINDEDEIRDLTEKIEEAPSKAIAATNKIRRLLKKRANSNLPQLVVSTGHSDYINSVAISPDGKLAATGSDDETVKLFSLATGKELRTLKANEDVYAVCFSPDGKFLAATDEISDEDEGVVVWDIVGGNVVRKLVGVNEKIKTIAYSPDGKFLAAGAGKIIRVWDANTGQILLALTGHEDDIYSVAFSPDGKLIASGSDDDEIKIWNAENGKELKTLSGHSGDVSSVAFSPDGKSLASGSADDTVKLWNVETGQPVKTFIGHLNDVSSVAFSADNRFIVSGSADKTIKIWAVGAVAEVRTLTGNRDGILAVSISPDGRTIISGSRDNLIKLWDTAANRERQTISGSATLRNPVFSPDKSLIAFVADDTIQLRETATGKLLRTYEGKSQTLNPIVFSPDGKLLAIPYEVDQPTKVWNIESGKLIQTIPISGTLLGFSQDGKFVMIQKGSTRKWNLETGKEEFLLNPLLSSHTEAYSANGKLAARANKETIMISDYADSKDLFTLTGHTDKVTVITFDPQGSILASGGDDKLIKLWDVKTGKELKALGANNSWIYSLAFSPDGKYLAGGTYNSVGIWEVESGKLMRTFDVAAGPYSLVFDARGSRLAVGGTDNNVQVRNVNSGALIYTLKGHTNWASALTFSKDGKLLASGSWDKSVKLWDLSDGREIRSINNSPYSVDAVKFSDDESDLWVKDGSSVRRWSMETGKEVVKKEPEVFKVSDGAKLNGKEIQILPEGNALVFVDTETNDEIAKLTILNDKDWVVTDSKDGLFDSSPGAESYLYYVVSSNEFGYEIVDLSQLKERYYEPNLLPKLLGFNKEPLKDVTQFKEILLPPAIEAIEPKSAKASVRQVRIRNRKGGIGRVQVFVNGREFIPDARDKKLKANPNLPEYVLSFDLKNAPVVAGQKPEVKVVAWNYDPQATEQYKGYISSRGTDVIYLGDDSETSEPPTLYAIIGGVSDYNGAALDLKFAAKDAEDIYKAIQIGGKNLFGVERVKIRLLSTGDDPSAVLPSKENFRKAFAEFALQAKPNDILFVYLSGHGTTLNLGSDTYYYLTQEASTTNREILSKDSQLLSGSTISSEELTNWHKSIKALKQVLILDTCAAGAIGNGFKIAEKKEISSDAKRALERMKDRIGFHVLMGSAADAVSYEASQYGQGLLTYSLLQGMRGAALDETGQIDVSLLFNYAANTVPNLAKDIGGIQRPEIRVPTGGASFAVGIIRTDEEKRAIPLANVKPLILKPRLQNRSLGYDNLKLERLLKDRLIETSFAATKGESGSKVVFVDIDEMPDAILPAGSYELEGEIVKVRINLVSNDNVLKILNVEGNKNKLAELIENLTRQIIAAAADSRF